MKKSVSFKQQNYHCVYEYPRDDSESFDVDIGPIWDRSSNYFDLSSFSGLLNYYLYIFIFWKIKIKYTLYYLFQIGVQVHQKQIYLVHHSLTMKYVILFKLYRLKQTSIFPPVRS